MKSTAAVAAFALAVSGVLAQDMTINTPTSLVQCLPALLTWSGGKPPYFLSVVPGGQSGAAPLVDLGQQDSTSLTWVVNVAQGTSVGLELRDSTGLVAQSAPVTIQNGSNSTCVGQTAQTSSASAGQTTAGGSGTTAGTTGGSGSTSTGGASSPSSTKPTSSGSGSPSNTASGSTTSNSASKTQVGVAGAVGAAVLALFL